MFVLVGVQVCFAWSARPRLHTAVGRKFGGVYVVTFVCIPVDVGAQVCFARSARPRLHTAVGQKFDGVYVVNVCARVWTWVCRCILPGVHDPACTPR